ncbi:MAG TPA: SagB/ThcOx family dehydrogenase [Phycisphaerae bacterium]|nr:SagB/ThcOx family dehydrogenase [Phycisphaerae bacterium]
MKPMIVLGLGVVLALAAAEPGTQPAGTAGLVPLPAPSSESTMGLEDAIRLRRSCRHFSEQPLRPKEIGQLCWAGQGITDREHGFRASPSAGALYPVELFVVTAEGVDRYVPEKHAMQRHLAGDVRKELQRAALGQSQVGQAPASIVVAADVSRTARKYRDRAERYCWMEAGHVAQNVLLQATALNLGGVPVGAFEDDKAAAAIRLPKGWQVLYLLPIGHPG